MCLIENECGRLTILIQLQNSKNQLNDKQLMNFVPEIIAYESFLCDVEEKIKYIYHLFVVFFNFIGMVKFLMKWLFLMDIGC